MLTITLIHEECTENSLIDSINRGDAAPAVDDIQALQIFPNSGDYVSI